MKKATSLMALGALMMANAAPEAIENRIAHLKGQVFKPRSPADVATTALSDLDVRRAKYPKPDVERRDLDTSLVITRPDLHKTVIDAVMAAYALGIEHTKAESAMVNDAVAETYGNRADHLLPTCVAAIMEQAGMATLTLDLTAVATVFNRAKIDHVINDDMTHIDYSLSFFADEAR